MNYSKNTSVCFLEANALSGMMAKWLVIASILLVSFVTQAANLHVIVVIQESAPGSVQDKQKISQELSRIERFTNLRVSPKYYTRNNISPSFMNSLSIGSDDVVWFYYSGHGRNAGDGYPAFSNSYGAFSQTAIHNGLKRKGARFCLTIFDCCNVGVTTSSSGYRPGLSLNGNTDNSAKAYRLMFQQSHGDLLVCSAKDENYSYGSGEIGGFFTSSFFEAVRMVNIHDTDDQKDVWVNVLKKAKADANRLCRQYNKVEQNPKYSGRVAVDLNGDSTSRTDTEDVIGTLFTLAEEVLTVAADLFFQVIDSEN
jgi:hypothetical protein